MFTTISITLPAMRNFVSDNCDVRVSWLYRRKRRTQEDVGMRPHVRLADDVFLMAP